MKAPRLLTAALLAASVSALPAATVFDNGESDRDTNFNLSDLVQADDFSLTSPTTVTGVRFWAVAAAEFAPYFSGKIGWAIYSHDGDNTQPLSLLFSGTDTTPTVVPTGYLVFGFEPEQQVDIEISAPLTASTTYWLALHEGDWGSASDGTRISWLTRNTGSGSPGMSNDNEAAPDANWNSERFHLAFQLFDSGEPVPEPGTWAAAGFVALAGLWTWHRRQRQSRQ